MHPICKDRILLWWAYGEDPELIYQTVQIYYCQSIVQWYSPPRSLSWSDWDSRLGSSPVTNWIRVFNLIGEINGKWSSSKNKSLIDLSNPIRKSFPRVKVLAKQSSQSNLLRNVSLSILRTQQSLYRDMVVGGIIKIITGLLGKPHKDETTSYYTCRDP